MIPKNNRERFIYAIEPVAMALPYMLLGAMLMGVLYGITAGIIAFFVFLVSVWLAAYWILRGHL